MAEHLWIVGDRIKWRGANQEWKYGTVRRCEEDGLQVRENCAPDESEAWEFVDFLSDVYESIEEAL